VSGDDQELKKTLGLKSQAAVGAVVRKAMKVLRTEHSFAAR
jgi:hypothetical protein